MPDDDHGQGHAGADPDGKAITGKTFKAAGNAFGQSKEASKENTRRLLDNESGL